MIVDKDMKIDTQKDRCRGDSGVSRQEKAIWYSFMSHNRKQLSIMRIREISYVREKCDELSKCLAFFNQLHKRFRHRK